MKADRARVILNDRPLRRPWTGVGHYIAQLIAALREHDPELDLLPFYQTYVARGPDAGPRRPPVAPGTRYQPRWPPRLRHVVQDAYNAALGTIGRVGGYQVYHEPNHIPGHWPGAIVTTIHDLSALRCPAWHPPDRVRWYERDFFAALPRSRHFITVSQFSKREMVDLLGIEPDRITVIGLGPRAIFHPRPAQAVAAWLTPHGLPRDYLLYVGTIEPRKNIDGLLAAYAGLPPATRQRVPLLMAGMGGWGRRSAETLVRHHGLDGQVHLLGYVEDEELAYLYAGARALVWPTFYEGFGLPPLECMASGTPVISSNTSSIPEVVGDAGILVDPNDAPQIGRAIARVLDDRQFARSLAARGLERSRTFSWPRAAAGHAAIYRRLANARSEN